MPVCPSRIRLGCVLTVLTATLGFTGEVNGQQDTPRFDGSMLLVPDEWGAFDVIGHATAIGSFEGTATVRINDFGASVHVTGTTIGGMQFGMNVSLPAERVGRFKGAASRLLHDGSQVTVSATGNAFDEVTEDGLWIDLAGYFLVRGPVRARPIPSRPTP